MPRLACATFAVLLLLAPAARAADRVGSETCRSCHSAAYNAWKVSAHAKAADSLSGAQKEDPRCTHCHAPDLARVIQEGVRGGPHAEAGVTCEVCHGAGQYYSATYVMRDAELARAVGLVDPGQRSCFGCHTPDSPSLTPFDFAAKVKLIDHWSQEKLLQEKAKEKKAHPAHAEDAPAPPASSSPASPKLTGARSGAGR